MDVTPQLIEQIEFSEKFRGYDPDQVDDFLERVGASLAELTAEVAELGNRAERAEAEATMLRESAGAAAPTPPAAGRSMSDEEEIEQATRTLVLAKRTADAAVGEARDEASKLLALAQAQAEATTRESAAEADRLVREAQGQRDEMLRRAREDAENEFAAQRSRFSDEVRTLEAERSGLSAHVQALESRIGEYRSGIEAAADQMRRVLDDPTALSVREPLAFEASARAVTSPFHATGAVPLVDVADAAHEDSGAELGTADQWGPGSWSEIDPSAASDSDDADSDFDRPGDEATQAHTEFPSTAQQDRYLSKLDAAVNTEPEADEETDEALTAFFEGGDPNPGRRFGRKR